MDYQASKSGCKAVVSKKASLLYLSLIVSFCAGSPLFAQEWVATTTNPLTEEITISAVVPHIPQVYPDTPPASPPGPVNMVNTVDAVVFRGTAYPGSVVSVLKNGVMAGEAPANPDGTFEVRVRNVGQGTYSFGVRAEDVERLKSKLLMISVYVTGGVTTVVDGIFIPPTITTDKVEVKRGEPVTFLVRSAPNTELRLSVASDVEFLRKATSSTQGVWSYTFDSSLLEFGEYRGKAKTLTASDTSPYSDEILFRVTNETRLRNRISSLAGFRKRCDLNNDDRVNILDFSIMAFWYKRLGFPARVDLSDDGKVNLTDLSILAYCWTG
jgi:hypothetical protein